LSARHRAFSAWLQLPEIAEPRAYVLPRDRASAEQLQNATREAEQNGSGVQMRLPVRAFPRRS
jgi:hypothetical protein